MDADLPAGLRSLLSRRSTPALQLAEPGPSQQQIDLAVDAALCAPDHGALRPLRLLLVRGAARQRLSELLVTRMQSRDPATPPGKLDKARRMPLVAPLLVVAAARVVSPHKVPELEQLLAAGAGVMNLLNAFHAQGFGAVWLTGGNSYDPLVAGALGLAADERCIGFVYVGSVPQSLQLPERRIQREQAVREWNG